MMQSKVKCVRSGSGFSGHAASGLQVGAPNEAAGLLGQPQQQLGGAGELPVSFLASCQPSSGIVRAITFTYVDKS